MDGECYASIVGAFVCAGALLYAVVRPSRKAGSYSLAQGPQLSIAGSAGREVVRSMTMPSHTNHTICSNPKPYAKSLSAGTTDVPDADTWTRNCSYAATP